MPPKIAFLLCCAVFGGALFLHSNARQANAPQFAVAQNNTRIVRVATASGPIGGMVGVPIELVSQGDENAIGFSLTFDPAVLSNPVAALGTDATGAGFNVNTNQAGQGRIGLALALPANQKFSVGVRQLVVVTFNISPNANFGTTAINFGDQPVSREISDVNANALTATYTSGQATITKGFEADVTPRPDGDGNGAVTITDWVQLGRFVAGLETASPGNEFQRADCAPRETLGDGRISITDWTQAGRYAAALDPIVAAGGPTNPSQGSLTTQASLKSLQTSSLNQSKALVHGRLLPSINGRRMTIEIEAQGFENAIGFSLQFNASQWRMAKAVLGKNAQQAALHINTAKAERGRIGFVLALPAGKSFQAGGQELLICQFEPISINKSRPLAISFSDQPVRRELSDHQANVINADFVLEGADVGVVSTVSAASFEGEDFAPEQIVSAFGDNLVETTLSATALPLPTSLSMTSLKITDSRGVEHTAPLFFVSPSQINFLIPADTAEGLATVTVCNGNEIISIGSIHISSVSPGLFTANADGQGVAAAIALRVEADGSQQFEPTSQFDSAQERFVARPLKLASKNQQLYLILFGTGWQSIDARSIQVKLGEEEIPAIFAGRQGQMSGLDQINLLMPHSLRGRGELKLEVIVDGKKANPVWLNVSNR